MATAYNYELLLGSSLIDSAGKVYKTSEKLPKTYVALYFSAVWCGPCRQFTPLLKAAYAKLQESGKNFEVVFVSWDNDNDGFQEYIAHMPWLAIPFENQDVRKALNAKYHVTGIPTLVMLGPDGALLNENARPLIAEDPECSGYPWGTQTIYDLLQGDLWSDEKKTVVKSDVVKNKIFAIYFSASWCPSCRGFTPSLVDIHEKLVASGVDFPIIWCSRDKEEQPFLDYFSHMKVLAVPFGDSRRDPLYNSQGIKTIPCVCIFDEKGHRIRFDGRDAMVANPAGYPWMPPPIVDIATNPTCINEKPCFICVANHDEAITKAFNSIASELRRESTQFVIAHEENKALKQLTTLTHNTKFPALFVIDILQDGAYYQYTGELKYEPMKEFAKLYFDGKIERQQMG